MASAGLLNVETLNVTGTQTGAVTATSVNVTNLAATNVSATNIGLTNNLSLTGSLSVGGGKMVVDVSGNVVVAGALTVGGNSVISTKVVDTFNQGFNIGPSTTTTKIGGNIVIKDEKYASVMTSGFDNQKLISEIAIGRGSRMRVTSASKFQICDSDNNIVISSELGSEEPFANLVIGQSDVVDLMANGKNDWEYVSGSHEVVYNSVNKSFRIMGNEYWNSIIEFSPTPDYGVKNLNTWFGTKKDYGNFQLQMDVQINAATISDANVNGGIIPHCWAVPIDGGYITPTGTFAYTPGLVEGVGIQCEVGINPSTNGTEYDEGWSGFPYPIQYKRGGVNYDNEQFMTKAEANSLFPAYNVMHYKIECRDWVIKCWINGKMVSKYYENIQDNEAVARKIGKIALQGHISSNSLKRNTGGYVEYSNILVKEIDSSGSNIAVRPAPVSTINITGNLKNNGNKIVGLSDGDLAKLVSMLSNYTTPV
jgi:hypothetical protein